MQKKIRVGSRGSALAIAQTRQALKDVQKRYSEIQFELVTIKTTGDRILDKNLDQIGGKGLFVKELDQALLDGYVDLTVHSLKDLPMEIPENLPLLGFTKREDPRDVLLVKEGRETDFYKGCIGTSSRRRAIQLQKLYPEANFRGIRGNVQTRLKKLETEQYDATILAMAGLKRLGMEQYASRVFSVDEIIPAAGQGILVFQGIKNKDYRYLNPACSMDSYYEALAERSFVRYLDGGCSSPIAAYAKVEGNRITLKGLYYHEKEQDFWVEKKSGDKKDAEMIGIALAKEFKMLYKKSK